MFNETPTNPVALRLGFWSAFFATLTLIVFTVCFAAVLLLNPIFMWTNLADYVARAGAPRSLLPEIAQLQVLIFGPLFVLMLNSVHEYAREEHKALARVGLCFGLAFAVLSSAHYWVQLSAVRVAEHKGDWAGLEQIL